MGRLQQYKSLEPAYVDQVVLLGGETGTKPLQRVLHQTEDSGVCVCACAVCVRCLLAWCSAQPGAQGLGWQCRLLLCELG